MIKYDVITPGMEVTTKIRYKDKGTLSNIYPDKANVKVRFYEKAKGIAAGPKAQSFMKEMMSLPEALYNSGALREVDSQ